MRAFVYHAQAAYLRGDAFDLLHRHLGRVSADFEQLVVFVVRAPVYGRAKAARAARVSQLALSLL